MFGLTEKKKDFFVHPDYGDILARAGISNFEAVFNFNGGQNLHKADMAGYRTRIKFSAGRKEFFLKRYSFVPASRQIRNWLSHRSRRLTMSYDIGPAQRLKSLGIATPKVVACGGRWKGLFEQNSFVITEQVARSKSLEKQLPDCFLEKDPLTCRNRREFINSLADFAKAFHCSGLRHRDFYLCHIFYSQNGDFTLIDLNRVFRPIVFRRRYRAKDIAQLYYSAPGSVFSRSDRLRFYKRYAGAKKLKCTDRRFISAVKSKAAKMARHDMKHSKTPPFLHS